MAASKLIADTAIRFKLGRRATDLNRMATSNVNSDAAIRASFAGCVRVAALAFNSGPFTYSSLRLLRTPSDASR
ncbi:hypothetical protein PCANC_15015 [Puccinia coronata f. sp. avenae]|uniref:Uncharacterized protein n=1 Tax=Puccinia coronata f. sp. avenae TaxID=200324 RepID=A0A2N5STL0_9BASI|nr:hypothetical protein PCANC_15015 [Puccinia coronata f. sp. avenae]